MKRTSYNIKYIFIHHAHPERIVSRLTLHLMGGFQVELDGCPLTHFKSNKARALLAYLAVEAERAHRRAALAALLWPERSDDSALKNLRYTLASLRRTIRDATTSPPFLLIERDTIQFNQAGDAWLDVAHFERQVNVALGGGHAPASEVQPAAAGSGLQGALALYRGAFLEGFSLHDAAPFEEWLLLRREQIDQLAMAALSWLTTDATGRGDYRGAQRYARRQVALEPWNEEAHRTLIRALALDGQRSAALHQFDTCCRILRTELGVEPSDETVLLHEAIRTSAPLDRVTGELGSRPERGAILLGSPPPTRVAPQVLAREEPIGCLNELLGRAMAGAGCVAFVTGEAGSGKSVLLAEFARRAQVNQGSLVVAGGACDAVAGIGDPYLPFREILQLLTGDTMVRRSGATLTPESARRLWRTAPDAIRALVEHGPALIDMFVRGSELRLRMESLVGPSYRESAWAERLAQLEGIRPAAPREAAQQDNLFDQFTRFLLSLAEKAPLCLIVDDLQWADAGTASLLFHLGRRIENSRILLAVAYRSNSVALPANGNGSALVVVVNELQRMSGRKPIDLDECDGRTFITALLQAEPNSLQPDFAESLYQQTEGHPLFAVELLSSLKERGDLVRDATGRWQEGPALRWENLPARVEAAIAERIGSLPDECRELLEAASVEGQEFSAEILAGALGAEERTVINRLSGDLTQRYGLVAATGLHRLGHCKRSSYRFRHHLFQAYLYNRLDPVRRMTQHEAIGHALEAQLRETSDEPDVLASRLAWHFEAAGLPDKAALQHLYAGRRAIRLAAHEEAIAHLNRGLSLQEELDETPKRMELKTDLQVALASSLGYAKGFWAPERIEALQRAYDIARRSTLLGSAEHWRVLATAGYFALWSAELVQVQTIAEELLRQAEMARSIESSRWAHCLMGCSLAVQGKLMSARKHLDEVLMRPLQEVRQDSLLVGIHVGLTALAWKGFVLWQLGYPDQAFQCLAEAESTAEKDVHPTTLGHIRTMAAIVLLLYARDDVAARRRIAALERSGTVIVPFERLIEDQVDASGAIQDDQILHWVQRGHGADQPVEGGLGRAARLLLLAHLYADAGHAQAGLEIVNRALTWIEQSGASAFEPEAFRLRGQLLLQAPLQGEDAARLAEESFRKALETARRHEARWWELRATVSLLRLLLQGADAARQRDVLQRLSSLYGWFTEGFETVDLAEARQLLGECEELP